MKILFGLRGKSHDIKIWYDNSQKFLNKYINAVIVQSKIGYTSFNNFCIELRALGYYRLVEEIYKHGKYVEEEAEKPTIRKLEVNLQDKLESKLRWVVLVPSSASRAYYERYKSYDYEGVSSPSKTWFYEIAWTAIYAAVIRGSSKTIGISHLTPSLFEGHQVFCIGETLGHWADREVQTSLNEVIFLGCCIEERTLHQIPVVLNPEGSMTYHRPIKVGIREGKENELNYEDIIIGPDKAELERIVEI